MKKLLICPAADKCDTRFCDHYGLHAHRLACDIACIGKSAACISVAGEPLDEALGLFFIRSNKTVDNDD